MPKRLSDVLNVSAAQLRRHGVFDRFVDIDSSVHVDPHLLRRSRVPEMKPARALLDEHFEKVIRLLRASKKTADVFYQRAVKMLTFPELPAAVLGDSVRHNGGSVIGPVLARGITETAKQIVDAGIEDPELFELVGLLEEGIGSDRIS